MDKKTLRNIIIITGILLLGFLIWFLFFRNTDETGLGNTDRDGLSNPFGDFLPEDRQPFDDEEDFFEFESRDSKLRLISASPVSGYKVFDREVILQENSFSNVTDSTSTEDTLEEIEESFSTTTQTLVQYVSRENGNVFEINSDDRETLRVTNTTIPRVQKVEFLNNSNGIVYTTLDQSDDETIVNYLSEFDEYQEIIESQDATSSTSTVDFPIQLEGFFLADNIKNILVSPNDQIFAFLQNVEGFDTFSVGYLFDKDSVDDPELVFQSEISSFNPEWINETLLSFTTKPSYLSEGFSYVLDLESGEVEKRLGRKIALSTNYSPDNSKILYSELIEGLNTLKLYREEDSEDLNLGLFTLADKCTWHKDSVLVYCALPSNPGALSLPDVWYRGEYTFDDIIIEINTDSFENRIVLLREDRPSQFDIYNMEISYNGNYLVFQNKIDLSLWMLDLTE